MGRFDTCSIAGWRECGNLIADYIIDSDRDLFYSADKSITFAFVPGYDSGTDVKEGE